MARIVEIVREDTIETETLYQNLLNDIKETVGNLKPPLSPECCIYRVPKRLRKVNEAAYTPQVVSIGPLHHGKRTLKKMENQKVRYLANFLQVVESNKGLEELVRHIKRRETRSNKGLEELVRQIKRRETSIRQCYAETFDYLSTDQFVKMVLVDSAFIIELFLRNFMGKPPADGYDFILDKPWPKHDIKQDLILLENQLPFFLLKELYDLAFDPRPTDLPSFLDLTLHYFCKYNKQEKPLPETEDVKHFTNLLRYFQLPCSSKCTPSKSCFSDCYKHSKTLPRKVMHSVNQLRAFLELPTHQKPGDKNGRIEHLYSAVELHEAGVKFQVSQSKCLLDIKFTADGKLEMPCFKLSDTTESYIRNLMALEQCHYPKDAKICDYIGLMDYLINTVNDVELLVKKKIIVNWLGDHNAAAALVNKLGLEILELKGNHYSNIFRDLNAYYEVPHHKWKATLKHEYFRSPWRGASTTAAIILLVLTAIQTVCSLIGR
ncbi:hypothetical protein P3X46_001604 [Hevea brasiliensis]|uniref:Uncharacterized protein n=1 Tax=Hevea brasiliensis TaxID=3981 RepID=A0ABQ9NDN4_HEVBR|nr:UPF0481 protein At3g47200-like [Hevea brasiliensis]KAJ9190394.1 hypothetical protein P3X46_001604 [Hevea brasiliensis]